MPIAAPTRLTFLIRDLGRGGAQRQLVVLARELAQRADFEVRVVHFYPGAMEAELRAAGVQTFCVGKRHRWDLAGFFLRLVVLMRRLRPEVIHGYLHESNLMALLLKPLCGWPRVVWGIRDSQTDAATWGLLGRLSFRLNCLLSGLADQVIANSRAGRDYYVAQGYPPARFAVVPNGIDTSRFQPQVSAACGARLAMIGRLHPMKDHATLLRALAWVPEVEVVIIGDGEAAYLADMQALASALGVANRVQWQAARDDLPSLYPTLDALISCSAYGEGFSNVIGEAMASGLPCLASNVGDSAWLLNDARWVFPPGDPPALAAVLRRFLALDGEARRQLGEKNRQRVEQHFTLAQMVETTAALCRRSRVVLWLTTGLGTGGAEMMLTQLIRGLSKAEAMDGTHHVVVSLTAGGKYVEPLRAAGAEVHSLDLPAGKPSPRALLRLLQLAWSTQPEVIMGWMYHGCLAAVWVKLVRLGLGRVRWNIRQSLYDLRLEKRGSAWVIRSLAWLAPFTEIITYNSQLSARQHEALGYPRGKTRLVPNGFDLQQWQPRQDRSTTLCIGRFGRHAAMKDYPTFLQAAALIVRELPEVEFWLVGTAVDRANPELSALVTELGLQAQVRLLGERHDLPELTAQLTLAVSSSAFGEGFPNVVGEAMACGVPVVATEIGDTAWVMGDTGWRVPPRDPAALAAACLQVLRLPEAERRRLGELGRDRISAHFSLDHVLGQFCELIQSPPPP